ncbi:alpha/beta fold hydrolase [Haloarcula salinisoli]|uniref:Alpha/beta hydrolase n=1 Tax=Haloarcula salinisoli TaxID=2487746 RepID=A0A8J8C8F4_9EURY|nr:alpha/beta hydrolase [Halomicroarcula salinisoli]MBX0287058.1 alpha/beta hydrolase [Halomicroarcula salinisoli]MBX0304361.1 alpha/beta hydrolase [Halomicroarcula salinisoli]
MSETAPNAPLPDIPSVERTFREVNDVTLHIVSAGDPADPVVVLLHGFPEFWYAWSAYIEWFVQAGYRVLVPDQRGYNRSEKPDGIRPYRVATLAEDIVALLATEACDSAHLVGHDWGGTVAWHVALRSPETVDRLGIVNMPHPTVFTDALQSNPRQRQKSQYICSFQEPNAPEKRVEQNQFDTWVSVMNGPSRSGTFSETDFERYRQAWAEPGAPAAMINWYRALVQYDTEPPRTQVAPPTLLIWGENDQALVPELAPESMELCAQSNLEQFPNATHWILHEYPERVGELLLAHIEA